MSNDMSKRTGAWSAAQQVAYLRNAKGLSFDIMGEDEAESFLGNRNYFFKVKAFGKNYEKYYSEGNLKGRYINLDFAHLVELSRLDKHLRSLVLDLTLDIEHYIKVRINASAMRCGSDPYLLAKRFLERSSASIVSEQARIVDAEGARKTFASICTILSVAPIDPEETAIRANEAVRELLSVTQGRNPDYIKEGFLAMGGSPYSKDLVAKYADDDIPYWCLMELMSFGSVIKMYRTCFAKKGLIDDGGEQEMYKNIKNLLRCSQVLRNAAAHNDCLLNGLSQHSRDGAKTAVKKKLVEHYGFVEADLADVATVRVAMDVAAVLMCYDAVVPDGQTRLAAAEVLFLAKARFAEHRDWFSKNYHVVSFLGYAEKLFEAFSVRLQRR